jgi:hypothetical protein
MRPRSSAVSEPWTFADAHFLAAAVLVLLFTAQRLTGYMSLYLYQRLPYDDLVLLAHFLGGAGLVAAATMGTSDTPMKLRSVRLIRVVVNAGWLVASFLVLVLWYVCVPRWRPETSSTQIAAALAMLAVLAALARPVDRFVSALSCVRVVKIILPVMLWQAYSLDWELRLNFLKDEMTATRAAVQWNHVATDLLATALGLSWTLWVQRRGAARLAQPNADRTSVAQQRR